MTRSDRTAVLLGAGASFDAGIPLTAALADQVLATANEHGDRRTPSWLRALNFTYAAMFGYLARDGSNPVGGINIERVISALRLLRDRQNHEAAPFVSAWRNPELPDGQVQADKWESERFVKNLAQALGLGGQGAIDQRAAVENIGYFVAEFSDAAKRPVRRADYAAAEREVLQLLGKILRPKRSVEYLSPIADLARSQARGVDVVTLNYDLAIEQMASEQRVFVDRGVCGWPGQRVSFRPNEQNIRLYKVHGSLDWKLVSDGSTPHLEVAEGIVAEPWIVVGDREKLATDGPTLELLHAAEEALERAAHLVIVGYSFTDNHINHVIRNWMLRDSERTIAVVDPTWAYSDARTFRGRLIEAYGGSFTRANSGQQRLFGFQGGAATELRAALDAHDAPPETIRVTVEQVFVADNGAVFVRLRNSGAPLSHITFRSTYGNGAPELDGEHARRLVLHERLPPVLTDWASDETLSIRFWLTRRSGDLQFEVSGHTLASHLSAQLHVQIRDEGDLSEVGTESSR